MKPTLIIAVTLLSYSVSGQNNLNWTNQFAPPKALVQNDGQFSARIPHEKIEFGYEGNNEHVFFCDNKVYFHLFSMEKDQRTDGEKMVRARRREKEFTSMEEWKEFEKEGKRMKLTTDVLVAEWIDANEDVIITGTEQNEFTHSYLINENGKEISKPGINSFQKITYKNIYNHIDIEYNIHSESGIKYTIILHPGANLQDVKLRYSKTPELKDGKIITKSLFGNITDHSPVTFYKKTNKRLVSEYKLNGNEISFHIENYDSTQTVIIDPWTQTPAFASNWDCVWECETDAAGNTYIIGGVTPLQLIKYNTAGAVQWTYNTPYDTTAWLGTLVTDNAGVSYITNGSVAAMIKVSTAGALVWSVGNGTGMLSAEYWNIAFNCDQTKLVTGGTGGGIPPLPYIYDINPANGAVLSNLQVTGSGGLMDVQEVRSITATENEKYYWMTHDSIGYVSQVFTACLAITTPVKTINSYNLGYKCEDWRYDNSGMEAIAYYDGYAYVNRGNRLDKRAFNTGAIIASVAIPGGSFAAVFGGNVAGNSGIAIDNCGNIFVGSKSAVVKYDQNLTQLASYAVAYNVYDIAIGTGGDVIACGSTGTSGTASRTGYVSSINGAACAPFAMVCCNATICPVDPLCTNDAPITLDPEVAGGTWSSTAPGFNASTGVFSPSVSGAGTFTFYYTMACGSDSLNITVSGCVAMTVCREANGSLTVSGGSGPYTWSQPVTTVGCQAVIGPGCGFFDRSQSTTTYANFTTGVTVIPPAGADTVRVTDNIGTVTTYFDITAIPACVVVLPVGLVFFEGKAGKNETIDLSWKTETETNNDYFTVERSHNSLSWEFIGKIKGAGTSSSATYYFLNDENPYYPVTYYRLYQSDFDGTARYLSTIAVNIDSKGNLISDLHPNPVNESVYFTYTGESDDQPLRLFLINSLGEQVKKISYTAIAPATALSIDISDLPNGVYQLVCVKGTVSAYKKLFVIR